MRRSNQLNQTGADTDSRRGTGASHSVGTCTAVIGSMTRAMKAQALLSEAAVRASLVKVSSAQTTGGCAYGVDFPCTQRANVQVVLERAGVRVREYLQV
ncbi:MAG: DUF3343 domain-containing protein [Clostridia bacterium]|nr:DUF3343 domain-containing protein [Clostridia bacterium]